MSSYREIVTKVYKQLTKEQLIWLLCQWDNVASIVIEILVDVSKCHISEEDAICQIRECFNSNYLTVKNLQYTQPIKDIQTQLDFLMGKISRHEYRIRLGFEDDNNEYK